MHNQTCLLGLVTTVGDLSCSKYDPLCPAAAVKPKTCDVSHNALLCNFRLCEWLTATPSLNAFDCMLCCETGKIYTEMAPQGGALTEVVRGQLGGSSEVVRREFDA